MILTNDKLLMECCPSNIDWDVYMRDCEKAVNISELHSDEWSTEDEDQKILIRAEEIRESIGTGLSHVRYRLTNAVDKESRPKDNMPRWWISSNWIESDEDDDDKNHQENDEVDNNNCGDDNYYNNNGGGGVGDDDKNDNDGEIGGVGGGDNNDNDGEVGGIGGSDNNDNDG
ncbi:unnamed protein product [Rhizophagus irregularis]|nr:unnamed protein product [Rhizophagus irregularis]